MDKKTILFYAPVGTGVPAHLLGGGEKGCRRTREILENAGYKVSTVDKANMSHGVMEYIKNAVKAYFTINQSLHENPEAILYVVGFYEKNLILESMLIHMGKKSHKVIYEARNGRLVKAYKERGKLYRRLMDYVLKSVDLIFAQGQEYVDFIRQRYNKTAVYTPNYVLNRSLKPYASNRPLDSIRLLYFGRISESKNVDIVIKTAAELEKRGYNTITTLIGGYTEVYKEKLDLVVKKSGLNFEKVRFWGQQPFEKISEELQKTHFFVFPSQEKMEGHSNSLTEAMTFGVVPIVSTAGFNASIVGDNRFVVSEIKYSLFADIIDKILKEDLWEIYSKFVYNRIKENYTEDIVKTSILKSIRGLEV
nr:glycosyltransferase family 4 protein [uncultured Anaerobutyricum sp.]